MFMYVCGHSNYVLIYFVNLPNGILMHSPANYWNYVHTWRLDSRSTTMPKLSIPPDGLLFSH